MIKIALTFQALTRVRSDMFCWQKIFKKKSPLKHNGDFIKRDNMYSTHVILVADLINSVSDLRV